MKKIGRCILAILLLTCSVMSKASLQATPTIAESNTYTQDKENIVVTVKQPQFAIKLKSNPTTGYSWFLHEYDSNLVTAVKHYFEAPSKDLIGAPGFEWWVFKVKPAGFAVPQQTTIRFIYTRPWQGNDNSSQAVFHISTQGN